MKQVLSIKHANVEYPVIEIDESERSGLSQVVIRFIHQQSHLTLHEKPEFVLFTVWDKNYWSTWSSDRVEIARRSGWESPDKHAHYIFQNNLGHKSQLNAFLGSRSIHLTSHAQDAKYLKSYKRHGVSSTTAPTVSVSIACAIRMPLMGYFQLDTCLGVLIFEISETS